MYHWQEEEVIGKPIFEITVPAGEKDVAQRILQGVTAQGYWEGEYTVRRKDGSTFPAHVVLTYVRNGNNYPLGFVGLSTDISERKEMEQQLQHMARHDFLTDIPNRYSLEESLNDAVEKARRGQPGTLLMIDLDNFKLVNDSLGHTAGDELIVTLAEVLKSRLGKDDTLFRFGGDEFVVISRASTTKEAETLAENLRRAVDDSELCLAMRQACFNMTISVGIVMIDGTMNANKLLALADAALFKAKERGRNRVVNIPTGDDISSRLSETNKLISLIKNALKENMFLLHFQPVVQTGNGRVQHYEALLRLSQSNGPLIKPGHFIHVAERFGLMSQIDHWVVKSTLNILKRKKGLKVFINLSGVTLGDEHLLQIIEDNIREGNIEPSRLGFEITESTAVKDLVRAERWIRRIKDLGCSFALDDFGAGFSSFTYLRLLPVDYLKIDGSFIKNLEREPVNHTLVRAMNEIAHAMGKKTIAEFVENKAVLNLLGDLKIDLAQGFYLGKPAPLE